MFVFSNRIKEVMNQRGMSLKELGDRIGVNSSTLSKLFTNKTKSVTLSLLYDICDELDLGLSEAIVDCNKKEYTYKSQDSHYKLHRIKYLSRELCNHIEELEMINEDTKVSQITVKKEISIED